MAVKAGQIVIDISAGNAQFLVDMEKSNAKLQQFGKGASESGGQLVSSMQASSAAIRLLENPLGNNIRAVERFISLLPGMGKLLQAAFPLVGLLAFGDIFVRMGGEALKFFRDMEQAPQKMTLAFRELNAPIKLTNDELILADDRLKNSIAKLEGKPQNGIKEALDEARVAADKLSDSLDKDLDHLQKVMKENAPGFLQSILALSPGTSKADDRAQKLRLQLGDDAGNPEKQKAAIETELGNVVSDIQGVAKQKSSSIFGYNLGPELKRLHEYADLYQAELNRIANEQQNTADDARLKKAQTAKQSADDARQAFAEEVQLFEEEDAARNAQATRFQNFLDRAHEAEKRDLEKQREYIKQLGDIYEELRKVSEEMERKGIENSARISESNAKGIAGQASGRSDSQKLDIARKGALAVYTPPSQQIAAMRQIADLEEAQAANKAKGLAVASAGARAAGDTVKANELNNESIQVALDASLKRKQAETDILAAVERQHLGFQMLSSLSGAVQSIPGSIGGALASGIMGGGGKKGEGIGEQIGQNLEKAMKNIGIHLLGQIMTQMIEKLIATTIGQFLMNMLNNWAIHYASNPLGLFAGGTDSLPIDRPSIVGEKGPEMVWPKNHGMAVIPNHKTGGFLSGLMGAFAMTSPVALAYKLMESSGSNLPSTHDYMRASGSARSFGPQGNSSPASHSSSNTFHIYETQDAQETARQVTNHLKAVIPGTAAFSSN